MKGVLHGRVDGDAVAAVGTWDPLLAEHRDLFGRMRDEARARHRRALAVLLDPSPRRFLDGPWEWPPYDDVASRIRLMLGEGLDGVLRLRFASADIHAGAAELFAALAAAAPVVELWLGAGQTLGTGPAGTAAGIAAAADQHGVRVVALPPTGLKPVGREVRRLLASGRTGEAGAVVGRPPVQSRPRGGARRLAWPPGDYTVRALDRPGSEPRGAPLVAQVVAGRGLPRLEWPDPRIAYLAVVGGPGDAEGRR